MQRVGPIITGTFWGSSCSFDATLSFALRQPDSPILRVPGWPSVRVALKRPEKKGRSPGFCYFENKLLGETVRRTVLLVSGRTIGDRRLL